MLKVKKTIKISKLVAELRKRKEELYKQHAKLSIALTHYPNDVEKHYDLGVSFGACSALWNLIDELERL